MINKGTLYIIQFLLAIVCVAPAHTYAAHTPYFYNQDHLGNIRQVRQADTYRGTVIQTMNYYPFGAEFCDNSAKSYVQKHKYNGKEFDNMHGLNTYDYGARQYNPVTGRWDRIDPLCEKYYSISPFAYCANNPVKYVDPDGMKIVISKGQEKEVLHYINSLAQGEFGVKDGELKLIRNTTSKGFSPYYTRRLTTAINDDNNSISIKIAKEVTLPNGKIINVDSDQGGGVTISQRFKRQDGSIFTKSEVYISGNENHNIIDKNGNKLIDTPNYILMHELVGHAIPSTVGSDTGNAIENENKVRKEIDIQNERIEDENHYE